MNSHASLSRYALYQNPQLKRKDSSSEEEYDSFSEPLDYEPDFSTQQMSFKKTCTSANPQFTQSMDMDQGHVLNIIDTMAPKPVARAPIYNHWSQCIFDNELERYL